MAKSILIDEIHLAVLAPAGLRKADYDSIAQTLRRRSFERTLRTAVRGVIRRHPSLKKVNLRIGR